MGVGQSITEKLEEMVLVPPDCSYSRRREKLVWMKTKTGSKIPAYYIKRQNLPRNHPTFLFSHANAEDIGLILDYFKELTLHLNVNIFLYDYTGYGLARGRPSEEQVYADVEAAYVYMRRRIGIDWKNIIVYGRSIGTCPSVDVSTKFPVGGVILQAPVASIFRILFRLRFTLPFDQFANIDKVKGIKAPVYVVHGLKDEIVPLWHGVDLYKRASNKYTPFWVPNGGHNNLEFMDRTPFFDKLNEFVKFVVSTAPSKEMAEFAASCVLPNLLSDEDATTTSSSNKV